MGSLRDELLKKGLVTAERARRIEHEQRAHGKSPQQTSKREQVRAEARKEAERRAIEEAKKSADRERQRQFDQDREQQLARRRLLQLVETHIVPPGGADARRFHFKARDNKLPSIEVSATTAAALERGEVAVIEIPDSKPARHVVVQAEAARQVKASRPELVRFWNESGPAERQEG